MRIFITSAILIAVSFSCGAASVIVLDEGINTDQRWDAKNVTEPFQICSSADTVYRLGQNGQPPVFSSLALCKDETAIQVDKLEASQYQNKKSYTVSGQQYEFDIFGRDIAGTIRGDHGNNVSNALYSFDKSILQRPVQVFGIHFNSSDTSKRRWSTSYYNPSIPFNQQPEPPAWRIIRVLQHIANGDINTDGSTNQLIGLGAINISIVIRGVSGNELCSRNIGRDEVLKLRSKGIAVIAGLDNEDYLVTRESWPACIDSVIGVGGLTSPGLGVGTNNMDFFARDVQGNSVGNSFAAPRVAAAFAILHDVYPTSTLDQKYEALSGANSNRTRRTSVGSVTRPYIAKRNMNKAIEELGKILGPVPLNLPNDSFDYSDLTFWGPVYGGNQPFAAATLNLPANGGFTPAAKLQSTDQNGAPAIAQKIAAELQGLPRDVLFEFTGAIRTTNTTAALRLWVNGREIAEFKGFPVNSEADAQFVINRKHLNVGVNQIEIRPLNAGSSWGVKNIRASYLPIVPLQVEVTNTNTYGFNGNPRYLSGMRMSFNLNEVPAFGVDVSMEGWDIDVTDETSIFVNGSFVGRLSTTPNNTYGSNEVFEVLAARLREGTNYIELIQREPDSIWFGTEDEKWAVRNINVTRVSSRAFPTDPSGPPRPPSPPGQGLSAIPAIISLLLDDEPAPSPVP